LCAELAEAELALSRVDKVPQPSREERTAEWLDLVEQLSREVEAMLSGACGESYGPDSPVGSECGLMRALNNFKRLVAATHTGRGAFYRLSWI
jgi:hypothetical protein